jgi:hypothetical protein
MNKILLAAPMVMLLCAGAKADSLDEKNVYRDKLKSEVSHIKSELARCEKQRKGWIAGTVIGSVGIVGTGIGAAVQGSQLKQKKDALKELDKQQ